MKNAFDFMCVPKRRQIRNDIIYRRRGDECCVDGWSPFATQVLLLCLLFSLFSSIDAWVGGPFFTIQSHPPLDVSRRRFGLSLMRPCSTFLCFPISKCKILSRQLMLASDQGNDGSSNYENNEVNSVQWQLFRKHHARYDTLAGNSHVKTSWVGKWTTYDYVGDIVLETWPASVNYLYSITDRPSNNDIVTVDVTHTIFYESTISDCETCVDDPNKMRTIPIATFTQESIGRKSRLGACGMVAGPSILRSSGTSMSNISEYKHPLRHSFCHKAMLVAC
jgi:hypothetical protein